MTRLTPAAAVAAGWSFGDGTGCWSGHIGFIVKNFSQPETATTTETVLAIALNHVVRGGEHQST